MGFETYWFRETTEKREVILGLVSAQSPYGLQDGGAPRREWCPALGYRVAHEADRSHGLRWRDASTLRGGQVGPLGAKTRLTLPNFLISCFPVVDSAGEEAF